MVLERKSVEEAVARQPGKPYFTRTYFSAHAVPLKR
jgi:hypothetical protein